MPWRKTALLVFIAVGSIHDEGVFDGKLVSHGRFQLLDGLVDGGFEWYGFATSKTCIGRDNSHGVGVLNPGGNSASGKASEYHRVKSPNSSASQHGGDSQW